MPETSALLGFFGADVTCAESVKARLRKSYVSLVWRVENTPFAGKALLGNSWEIVGWSSRRQNGEPTLSRGHDYFSECPIQGKS
jgi:hypothetical protein